MRLALPLGRIICTTVPNTFLLWHCSVPDRLPSPCNVIVSLSIAMTRCRTYLFAFTAARTMSPTQTDGSCRRMTVSRLPSIKGRILTPVGVKRTSFPSFKRMPISGINMSLSTLCSTTLVLSPYLCRASPHGLS